MLNFLNNDQLAQKTEYDLNLNDLADIIHTLVRKVSYLENTNFQLESEIFALKEELNKTINFNNTAKDYFLGENNTQ